MIGSVTEVTAELSHVIVVIRWIISPHNREELTFGQLHGQGNMTKPWLNQGVGSSSSYHGEDIKQMHLSLRKIQQDPFRKGTIH